ncbi:MAG: hypothetical protein QM504_17410 [Pseudomonadota bacterium]
MSTSYEINFAEKDRTAGGKINHKRNIASFTLKGRSATPPHDYLEKYAGIIYTRVLAVAKPEYLKVTRVSNN